MPKFPEPPGVAELSAIPPVLAEMPLLTTYSRIFFAANDHRLIGISFGILALLPADLIITFQI